MPACLDCPVIVAWGRPDLGIVRLAAGLRCEFGPAKYSHVLIHRFTAMGKTAPGHFRIPERARYLHSVLVEEVRVSQFLSVLLLVTSLMRWPNISAQLQAQS